jgi:hypothetical protein
LKIFGSESGEQPVFPQRGISRSVCGTNPPQVSHLLNCVMVLILGLEKPGLPGYPGKVSVKNLIAFSIWIGIVPKKGGRIP